MLASGITYDTVEAAFVGYIFGASTCGQVALYQLGLTGIPIMNVNNNCATGSTALFQTVILVRACEARHAFALDIERMAPGSIGAELERTMPGMTALVPYTGAGACVWGCGIFRIYGGDAESLARMGKLLELELEHGVWGVVLTW